MDPISDEELVSSQDDQESIPQYGPSPKGPPPRPRSDDEAGVNFPENPVRPSSSTVVPEGWHPLEKGIALGEEPGSIVLEDGRTYGPETVEVDLSSYLLPIWRFRRVRGSQRRAEKGDIPVRRAYESLLTFLSEAPMSASEWTDSSFVPHGARASRAINVGIDDDTISGNSSGSRLRRILRHLRRA